METCLLIVEFLPRSSSQISQQQRGSLHLLKAIPPSKCSRTVEFRLRLPSEKRCCVTARTPVKAHAIRPFLHVSCGSVAQGAKDKRYAPVVRPNRDPAGWSASRCCRTILRSQAGLDLHLPGRTRPLIGKSARATHAHLRRPSWSALHQAPLPNDRNNRFPKTLQSPAWSSVLIALSFTLGYLDSTIVPNVKPQPWRQSGPFPPSSPSSSTSSP
jgi:hypothetical protein